jgi:hypothetical protein
VVEPAVPAAAAAPKSIIGRKHESLQGIDLAELDAILKSGPDHAAPKLTPQPEPVPPSKTTGDMAELDDLNFDLEAESKEVPAAAAKDSLDDIDLEMDFDLDDGEEDPKVLVGDKNAPAVAKTASGGADLELDGIALDLSKNEPANLVDDELDLDLDFNLEDQDESVAPAAKVDIKSPPKAEPPRAKASEIEEELSLDFDTDIKAEKIQPVTVAKTSGAKPQAADVDFGDLGNMLDQLDEAPEEEDEGLEELDLDLDFAPPESKPPTPKKAIPPQADGIDLDDLGDALDDIKEDSSSEETIEELDLDLDRSTDQPRKEAAALSADQAEELDLGELDSLLDNRTHKDAKRSAAAKEEELEELEFDLDAEYENKPISKTAEKSLTVEPKEVQAELDLSDIEQMLEGDGLAIKPPPVAKSATPGSSEPDDLGEIDLGEIEKAIEAVDIEPTGKETIEVEDQDLTLALPAEPKQTPVEKEEKEKASVDPMDLDLDVVATMAPLSGKTVKAPVAGAATGVMDDLDLDLLAEEQPIAQSRGAKSTAGAKTMVAAGKFAKKDDEFDLTDLGDLVEEPATAKADTIDTGDIELEFEIEDANEPVIAQTAARASRPFSDMTADAAAEVEAPPKKALARPRAPRVKRGTPKSLVMLLILVLLGAGGYFGRDYIVDFIDQNEIRIPYVDQIPYIGKYLTPKPKDPNGVLNLSTLDINAKFIVNEQGGRLFVITGKVRNGYSDMRNAIRLRANLFGTGKILIKTEQVYAGTVFSDQDLAAKPVAEIKQQLSAVPQAAKAAPGQSLPFMVVFSDLPENLDEYGIEPLRSQKVQ